MFSGGQGQPTQVEYSEGKMGPRSRQARFCEQEQVEERTAHVSASTSVY